MSSKAHTDAGGPLPGMVHDVDILRSVCGSSVQLTMDLQHFGEL